MDNEQRLKEARGDAQRRFDEICRLTLDGDKNLTALLVKACRAGMPQEKAKEIFQALRVLAGDAHATFDAAIAQPEPKVGTKPRVVL